MSTNGTISLIANGKTITTYNHSDSYFSGLGEDLVKFIRESDHAEVREKLATIRTVDESEAPTEADRLQYGKFFQNVSNGQDWYSLLRGLQGDIAGYLDAGIIPTYDWPGEQWDYVLDFDVLFFKVTSYGKELAYPFDSIPSSEEIEAFFSDEDED